MREKVRQESIKETLNILELASQLRKGINKVCKGKVLYTGRVTCVPEPKGSRPSDR